jgi:hypothetical protein
MPRDTGLVSSGLIDDVTDLLLAIAKGLDDATTPPLPPKPRTNERSHGLGATPHDAFGP